MSSTNQIYIKSSQDLENIISNLNRIRDEFHMRMTDIDNEERQLIQKWKGDASSSFDERWRRQYVNFENLYDLIGEYINALGQITENGGSTEQMNVTIASQ
jgi:WXG100 family type VII secretion target